MVLREGSKGSERDVQPLCRSHRRQGCLQLLCHVTSCGETVVQRRYVRKEMGLACLHGERTETIDTSCTTRYYATHARK